MTDEIHVLHVDDEPDFTAIAASFLEHHNDDFCVQTATNVDEGLDLLSNHQTDCIVSDYDMPGRTGIEFLEAVRKEFSQIPFILYTGMGSEEIVSEALSAGATDYMQKDIGTSQYRILANRILNIVEQQQAQEKLSNRDMEFIERPI